MNNWQSFENESTISLIGYINGQTGSDDETRQNAFLAFYFRFEDQLRKKCEIICRNYGYDKEVAIQITEGTFKRFLSYPKYCHEKSRCSSVDEGVLFYLFRISQRLLIDYYKKTQGFHSEPYDGSEEIVYDYPVLEEGYEFTTEEAVSHYRIIKEALETLSPKHKIIYLTYKQFEVHGHTLPRRLLLKLRDDLGLQQTTVRSYKNEAYHKINEYFRIHGIKKKA